jgi:large subunit ribosomal protein L29
VAKKSASVRDLDDAELVNRLGEAKQELFNLRFQNVTGQLDNTARLGVVRKEIARINTVLREREIALAEASVANGKKSENANG